MARAIARRLLTALATAAGISILTFLAIHARPDDAVARRAGELGVVSAEGRARIAADYGLDRPLLTRMGEWIRGVAVGDLGQSWSRPGESVSEVLRGSIPATLALTGSGMLLQLILGVALAAITLRRRGTWRESVLTSTALALHAVPQFCLGLLLLWPFAFKLGWFPTSGAASAPWEVAPSLVDRLHHLMLPVLCLSLGGAIVVARLLRTRWEEELGQAYVAAARARGLGDRRVLWRHALPSATGPLCTAIGLSLPGLVGGAVVVERVFNWPGLGSLLLDAIQLRDLPLVAGANLCIALLVSLGGLLSDLSWALIDPRVRAE